MFTSPYPSTQRESPLRKFATVSKAFVLFFAFVSFFLVPAAAKAAPCGYIVALESSTYANGKTTFVWSVYNPNPGNGSNGTFQDVSHFGVVFGSCVDPKDILSGGSYGIDNSQNCYTSPYLKFDYGTSGNKKSYYTLVLNGKYGVATTTAVLKSGVNTACCIASIQGVGCKETICTPPKCEITGNPVICVEGSSAGSTTLSGPAGLGYTYKWTGPNSFTATTQTITVNSVGTPGPGAYTLTVTTTDKCSSTCSVTVTVGQKPSCTITGNDKICSGQSASFTASGGATYKWTGPNGFTATTATISNLTQPGTYTVAVTSAGGCSSSCSKTLIVDKPECKITGNTVIPAGGSTSLTASGGVSYLWTGPNGLTATSATINGLTQTGVYNVTVTSAGGCKSTCSVTLTKTPPPPPPTNCGYIVTLEKYEFANGKTTFVWSVYNPNPGNGSNGTIQDLSHFGVVLKNCVDPKDIVSSGSYGVDKSQTCYTEPYLKFDFGTSGNKKTYYTLVLNGKYTQGTTLAVFKSGANTRCCTATIQGVGCKDSNCIPPKCEITGNPIICTDGSTPGSTMLSATSGMGYTYKWAGPNNYSATTQTITVYSNGFNGASPGVYNVTITNADGCTSTCSIEVKVSNIPQCGITGNTVICTDGSNQNTTTLTATPGVGYTYKWAGPNGYTSTAQTITVYSNGFNGASSGVYTVTITNADGCSSTCSVEVIVKVIPDCQLYSSAKKETATLTESSSLNVNGNLTVTAAPNPFRDNVHFVIRSKVSGSGILEVFNVAGVKIKTVFSGYVQAGKEQVIEFSAVGAPKGNLVYRMQVGAEQVTGKLVSAH